MSGDFVHRVNITWTNPWYITADICWWEFMQFFYDHPGFSFVAYGEGKTQLGTEPPASWLANTIRVSGSRPWGQNAWFVVQADNASNDLNGGGTNIWQAKFQQAYTVGFDDCNIADINYDWEGTTSCVCVRASAFGGWDESLLDFAPSGGEARSRNFNIYQGSNNVLGLDIIGDDDTIFWRGTAVVSGGSLASLGPARSRGGYIGMLLRKNADVNPFLFVAGRIYNETANTGYRSVNWCYDNNNSNYSFRSTYVVWDGMTMSYSWPSYSVGKNGNVVRTHRVETFPVTDISRMSRTSLGEIINWGMRVAQWYPPDDYEIIGQLRFLGRIGNQYAHGVRYGDNLEWLQFAYLGNTNTGVGMKWPEGIVNVW